MLDDVRQLREQRFADIDETEWGAICRHVQNVVTEGLMEPEVGRLVFNGNSFTSMHRNLLNNGCGVPQFLHGDARLD
jgi:hypothetical protein